MFFPMDLNMRTYRFPELVVLTNDCCRKRELFLGEGFLEAAAAAVALGVALFGSLENTTASYSAIAGKKLPSVIAS